MTHLVTRIRVYYLIGLAMIIAVGFWAAYKADHWIRMARHRIFGVNTRPL